MQYCIQEIDAINEKFDRIIQSNEAFGEKVTELEATHYETFLRDLLKQENPNLISMKHDYAVWKKNSAILYFARQLEKEGRLTPDEVQLCQERLCLKKGKSHSGVLVITIFTSGNPTYLNEMGETVTQRFSCKWNCYYCPNEPGQPRSYLKGEPGVLRANANDFDCYRQMRSRMTTLYDNGHPIDKLEVLVLGGTWESYPELYQDQFIRDMYYAANTFWENTPRSRLSLEEERDLNRDALCKIIGLTLETRPDTINETQIIRARRLGCTRFQIGIQHLDDDVLKKINRKCTTDQTLKAIELLKDWGYKVDGHWMPNLPGSTPEKDHHMFIERLLKQSIPIQKRVSPIPEIDDWQIYTMACPEVQLDQWKIYPCEVVPFTVIEKWYRKGEYHPYGEKEMTEILLETKEKMLPWIRLNRIIRDIPMDYIMASGDQPNMRQNLQIELKKRGHSCACIRCREVKLNKFPEKLIYRVREYNASNGTEYFISAEDPSEKVLCGFVRLRLPHNEEVKPIAWIRELHVYGKLQQTTSLHRDTDASQHRGIGKKLMSLAEQIAVRDQRNQVKVIAGEGTKRYYEKLGYSEGEYGYMIKQL
jgi:histone acetyltransferase (RNA polymerase elongator complex component)